MIHLKPVSISVMMKRDSLKMFEEYVSKFNCRMTSEIVHLPNGSVERRYSFTSKAKRAEFLLGLDSEIKVIK
ncbi:MAG: hypothetical protein IJ220_05060 [Clostridia bacterium]|nr:hypothetical protein [Clostridia bacterium]